MKILTLQFLTCAIKTCKSKSMTAQPLPPPPAPLPAGMAPEDAPPAETSSPFPLHPRDASLERTELDFNPLFILNILPRVDWTALKITAMEFGLVAILPGGGEEGVGSVWERVQDEGWREKMITRLGLDEGNPRVDEDEEEGEGEGEGEDVEMAVEKTVDVAGDEDDAILKNLHTLLLETEMMDGKLVCGSCGHEYGVKEGVGNFLLPAHLV